MDYNPKYLNFEDPSWKEPEDFLIPKPPAEGEWDELLKQMRGSGKQAKTARERLKTGFKEYLMDLVVARADSQRQLRVLLSKGRLALDSAVTSFQGNTTAFSDFVKAHIKTAVESVTPSEEAAFMKELEQKEEAKAEQQKVEKALQDEMLDMAIRLARTNREYLLLMWKGHQTLARAISSFKGDRRDFESFVRSEVERVLREEHQNYKGRENIV